MKSKVVTMGHGSGGKAMEQLLESVFLPAFDNSLLSEREDQARIDLSSLTKKGDRLAFTTDSYVIDPIFFPGGNIGELAVCGTSNDLAVSGAEPLYLSCGFILEEGFPLEDLKKIVDAMAAKAKAAGIQIVTGDTKVVQRGAADKIFINTSGIGVIDKDVQWGTQHIKEGDAIIVSGTLGDHGATILNLRENLGMTSDITSDCAVLEPIVKPLKKVKGVRAMRDATRGGVNAILHEFSRDANVGIEVEENKLPVKKAVRGICELLGLDPINFANEGKLVIIVAADAVEETLKALHANALGKDAAVIGKVVSGNAVKIISAYGVSRTLDLPYSEPLPRIC